MSDELKRHPVTTVSEVEKLHIPAEDIAAEEQAERLAVEEAARIAEQDDSEEAQIVKRTGLSPLSAIKKKCLDCCCGQRSEVYLCRTTGCTLWPFRKGHKPVKSGRVMKPEQREAARARFLKMHADKKAAKAKGV